MVQQQSLLNTQQFDEIKKLLIEIISEYHPTCKIYLFGSRARSASRAGSDIDLAVDAGIKLDEIVFSKIINKISESNIPLSVDVIDLNNISDDFKTMIVKDLKLWKN